MGKKGGGKGWCGDCLKAERLERKGLFRDEHFKLFYYCQSCTQIVRVRNESKKEWRKGTENLVE